MTAPTSLPRSRFPSVDASAWTEAAAAGSGVDRLSSRTSDGARLQPLYPTPFEEATPGTTRTSVNPWRVGQEYTQGSLGAIAEAIALDAEFGLDVAWVHLGGEHRCGGAFGASAGPMIRTAGELLTLRAAAGDRAMWIDAGLGSDDLEDAWAEVGGAGGPLYDPLGALAECGGLAVTTSVAVAGALRGVGRRERSVLIDGAVYHDGGATAAQELGLALSTLFELARKAEETSVAVPELAASVVMRLVVDSDLFASVAKVRAARWLWHCVTSKLGASGAPMHLCCRTARRDRTRYDPWVNMLRTTVETFAAAIGGADEVVADPFSRPLGEPRADARRWAMGAGVVLREESHLAHVIDPAGGSGYVESLTREIAEAAWSFARDVESSGGLAAALESGVVQVAVGDAARQRQRGLATGRSALTGVTVYPNLDEPQVDAGAQPAVKPALGLAPSTSVQPVPPLRLGAPFEALREASEGHREATGRRPHAAVVIVGNPTALRARLDFVRSLLSVGGFDVETSEPGAGDPCAGPAPFIAVLCAADEDIPVAIGDVAANLRADGAALIAVAGRPEAAGDRAAQVDAFVHLGVDVLATLTTLHRAVGVEV